MGRPARVIESFEHQQVAALSVGASRCPLASFVRCRVAGSSSNRLRPRPTSPRGRDQWFHGLPGSLRIGRDRSPTVQDEPPQGDRAGVTVFSLREQFDLVDDSPQERSECAAGCREDPVTAPVLHGSPKRLVRRLANVDRKIRPARKLVQVPGPAAIEAARDLPGDRRPHVTIDEHHRAPGQVPADSRFGPALEIHGCQQGRHAGVQESPCAARGGRPPNRPGRRRRDDLHRATAPFQPPCKQLEEAPCP